jgi:hypothetical protein
MRSVGSVKMEYMIILEKNHESFCLKVFIENVKGLHSIPDRSKRRQICQDIDEFIWKWSSIVDIFKFKTLEYLKTYNICWD